jgi:multiple sugar transport system substrate-binding protein
MSTSAVADKPARSRVSRRRRFRRKAQIIGALAACGTLLLAGCSGSGSGSSGNGPVTITFWDDNGGPRTPQYEHLIPIFEHENPGITVKYVGIPDSSVLQKYDTAILGGSPPDVGAIPGQDLSAIISQNALVPLNGLFEQSALKNELVPSLLTATAAVSPDGKTYFTLPFSGVPTTLWCNMTLFKKAGLACPTTWNAFFADAVKLTSSSAGQYGLSMRGGAGATAQLMEGMISYSGVKTAFSANGKSTFDNPLAIQFVQRFAALYKKATPTADINNAYLQMVAEFDSGKEAMMLHNIGSYQSNVSALGGEKNVAGLPYPSSPATPGTATIASPNIDTYGIFKSSPNQAADWRFIQFLLSATSNGYWNENAGQIPSNQGVLKQSWVQQQQPIKAMLTALSSKNMHVVEQPQYLPQLGGIENDMDTAWQKVLLGQMSPQQWVETLAGDLNSAQAQFKQETHK